jgi:acetylornithine/succinyldiaminopimelate/putrescine aminotransferase
LSINFKGITMTPSPFSPTSNKLMSINDRPAEVFVRGEGAWLWDAAGNRYLDWLQGWAVNALGHYPPVVLRACSNKEKINCKFQFTSLLIYRLSYLATGGNHGPHLFTP